MRFVEVNLFLLSAMLRLISGVLPVEYGSSLTEDSKIIENCVN